MIIVLSVVIFCACSGVAALADVTPAASMVVVAVGRRMLATLTLS